MNCLEPISFALDCTLPNQPWKGVRRRADPFATFRFRLPLLQPLEFEVAVLRRLMQNPKRRLYYCRHYTLEKQRWTGAERVSRAALLDGHSYEAAVALVLLIVTEKDVPEFRLTPENVRDVVARELRLLHRRGQNDDH